MPRAYVLGEALGQEASKTLPPWDGTGVPLPVDENGWPVFPDPDPEPEPVDLVITEPVEGATVPPDQPIRGTATPGSTVDLYVDTSDDGTIPVASTTATAGGTFEFVGGTPLTPGPEGLVVGVGDERSAKVNVTVEAAEAAALEAPSPESVQTADAGYDPGDYTVAEVQAYLAENPNQTDYVLARERAGKNRVTLTGD